MSRKTQNNSLVWQLPPRKHFKHLVKSKAVTKCNPVMSILAIISIDDQSQVKDDFSIQRSLGTDENNALEGSSCFMEERRIFQGFIKPPNNRGGHLCSWQLGAKLLSGNGMILQHQQKEVGENRGQSTASPEQVADDTCSNPTSHHWSSRPGSWRRSSNPSPASLVMSPHESSGFRSLAWDRRDFSLLPDSLSNNSMYSSARSLSHTCLLPLSTPISVTDIPRWSRHCFLLSLRISINEDPRVVNPYRTIYYSARKENKLSIHVTTWMSLLGNMLSERSQSQNATHYMFHLYNILQMA